MREQIIMRISGGFGVLADLVSRGANLYRLPAAGSGAGRCGAGDGEVPGAARERQCRNNQEVGCPSVGAVREAYEARGGRDSGTGDSPYAREAEVAVHPGRDQT